MSIIEWILLGLQIIVLIFIACHIGTVFGKGFYGILETFADNWCSTEYTIKVNGKTYRHCTQVTMKKHKINFMNEGNKYEFVNVEYSARRNEV